MRTFDVVIVGSGYGGSVMAARLAGARRVLVVERGRRWAAADFPRSLLGMARLYERPGRGSRSLWGMRLGKGVGNAFVTALGGSSVVNYGITVEPEDHVFEGWPVSLPELAPYYEQARRTLGPSPNPIGDSLGDKTFLDFVEPGRRRDIANTIDWTRCDNCGDCPLGCRLDAKRSLDRTYLAEAEAAGAELAVETEVTRIRRVGDGYELELCPAGEASGAPEVVRTPNLVLAAGTFGTLDLLRAHRAEFPLSSRFGLHMSMNGDAMAFLYNTRFELTGVSGAPISTAARTHMLDETGRKRTLTVMSGRIPRSVMQYSAWVMGALAEVLGPRHGQGDGLAARTGRRVRDLFGVREGGALSHTYMYKLDGQDGANGRMGTDAHGRSTLDWPDYRDDPILRFATAKLEAWAREVGGRIVRDPGTWPGMRSFGVHALGGCGMGTCVEDGVTDSFGRVFAPGGGVYPGLRIVDASILRSSVGVPPSLTISALAERSAQELLAS